MTDEQPTAGVDAPHTLILYDGVCGLCNRLVAFLLRHDARDQFRFATLQSSPGQTLLARHGFNPGNHQSVAVLANYRQPDERALTRSEAVLWVIGRIGGIWRILVLGRAIPLTLRDALYRFIAQRRYSIFGKLDACPVPRPEDRHKFLDLPC